MTRRLLFAVFSCLFVLPLAAVPNRLSLSDFTVHSDNPKYKYIGKGISEMISVELGKSSGIELIEREKRAEILEEMELSLADFANSEVQLKVGEMLAVNYVVAGEIVDMDKKVLISLRMIDVESGKIVWNEQLAEKLTRYERISGFFASSILDFFSVEVSETTIVKVREVEEKTEEAVVSFSEAVNHFDNREITQAKKELSRAKRVDPKNDAVEVYLWKLDSITPRFRVETEYFAPTSCPAYLGLINEDNIYTWQVIWVKPPNADDVQGQTIDGFYFKDYPKPMTFGYAFPIGNNLGLSVEYVGGRLERMVGAPFSFDLLGSTETEFAADLDYNYGGSLAIGYRLRDNFSLGASFRATYSEKYKGGGSTNPMEEGFWYVVGAGLVFLGLDNKLVVDTQVSWASQADWYVNTDLKEAVEGIRPLSVDTSIGYSLLDKKLTLSLRTIEDIFIDKRKGIAIRAVPVVEYWLFPFISARLGYENSHLFQNDRYSMGHGFLSGVTVKIWRFELSSNFTLRKKPTSMVPGYLIYDSKVLFGFSFNPGLLGR